MKLLRAYSILAKYNVPPDNFEYRNDLEWGFDLGDIAITEIELDLCMDELCELFNLKRKQDE